jgi:hypothetical protein
VSTIINPGTTPQVYTDDGRTIAAGDRVENVDLDEIGQSAVDSGRLRVLDEKKSAGRKSAKDKAASGDTADADSTTSSARRSGDTSS